MASPAIGGGSPRMPRQPGVPELVIDPIIGNPGNGRRIGINPPRRRIKPTPKPGPGRGVRPLPIDTFPQPMPYTPIKQTKAVNKVYKTY